MTAWGPWMLGGHRLLGAGGEAGPRRVTAWSPWTLGDHRLPGAGGQAGPRRMTVWGPWTLGGHRLPGAGGGREAGQGWARRGSPSVGGPGAGRRGGPHLSSDDPGHKPTLHTGPTPPPFPQIHDVTLTRKPLQTDAFSCRLNVRGSDTQALLHTAPRELRPWEPAQELGVVRLCPAGA